MLCQVHKSEKKVSTTLNLCILVMSNPAIQANIFVPILCVLFSCSSCTLKLYNGVTV